MIFTRNHNKEKERFLFFNADLVSSKNHIISERVSKQKIICFYSCYGGFRENRIFQPNHINTFKIFVRDFCRGNVLEVSFFERYAVLRRASSVNVNAQHANGRYTTYNRPFRPGEVPEPGNTFCPKPQTFLPVVIPGTVAGRSTPTFSDPRTFGPHFQKRESLTTPGRLVPTFF